MTQWMAWLILAGILVILELFSGTFYLLMLAVGMLAGALAAVAGASLEGQIIVAAIVGMIATVLLHRSRFGWRSRTDSARDPNVNLDVGQFIQVDAWHGSNGPGGRPVARVLYRGAPWDVELDTHAEASVTADATADRPSPGRYRIVAIRGSCLVVAGAA